MSSPLIMKEMQRQMNVVGSKRRLCGNLSMLKIAFGITSQDDLTFG